MDAQSEIKLATPGDVPIIVTLLERMQNELHEVDFDSDVVSQSVARSLSEHVHWFLFIDEHNAPFGTCHLQSVHNYWSMKRRYYLGGFYITDTHRKQGRFRPIYAQLEEWAKTHDGSQIYCHIHENNEKSLKTFDSVGIQKIEYALCATFFE